MESLDSGSSLLRLPELTANSSSWITAWSPHGAGEICIYAITPWPERCWVDLGTLLSCPSPFPGNAGLGLRGLCVFCCGGRSFLLWEVLGGCSCSHSFPGADCTPAAQLQLHAQLCPVPLFPVFFLFFFSDGGSGAALVPASPDPLSADEPKGGGDAEIGHSTALSAGAEDFGHARGSDPGAAELGKGTTLNLLPAPEDGASPAEGTTPPLPTATPRPDAKQTPPVKKKPPALKQANMGRKHPRLKPTLAGPPGTASPASPRSPRLPTAIPALRVPAEDTEQSPPELPWGDQATTSRPTLQISPSTLPPALPRPFPGSTGGAGEAPTAAPAGVIPTNNAERDGHGSVSEESQETTTSTIITTTVTTTEPSPGELSRARGYGAGGEHTCV